MPENKPMKKAWNKKLFAALGMVAVLAAMLLLFWGNTTKSTQSLSAVFPDVYFEGQYKIGDGQWQPVIPGEHIPATRGDVTLQGQFHLVAPNGEYAGPAEADTPLAFYANHIRITVMEPDLPPYVLDTEDEYAGEGMCGESCHYYRLQTGQPVTLLIHNPHSFGNETAVDEFLQELSLYADNSFEKAFAAEGSAERYMGLAFAISALVLLGTALFSTMLRIEDSGKLWPIGLSMAFAGGYFAYGAKGVSFWSDSIIGNTTIMGICMMLYMLNICWLILTFLNRKARKIGTVAVTFQGAACLAIALICAVADLRFYDSWYWWALLQSVTNLVLLICIAMNFAGATTGGEIASNIGAACLLLGFEADILGIYFGWWKNGLISKGIFIMLFIIAIVLVWQVIPRNINAARKTREMEAEQKVIRAQLQENRIAIMISQIQPHFIYNTLGTIQQLCKEDPQQAANLVHSFSVYLRGNFSELDNTAPIRFTKELDHVRCYTDIELVRFPDMTVEYDIQTDGFLLPALAVQPLVENAIKHGLMGREEGGTVTVTAYETETHYCVKVADDGVGFDENQPLDRRKHVGIRNVRERLQIMCGGTLTVESQPGVGTTALIQIPKEGKKS